jgi:light-regulated signal transduction histidine kinase (bacteriophytochrome)
LNDNGKPYQYIAIRADITERMLAQENLRLLNETLEKQVDERTAQLEVANKEMESFSYSVSHDLRSPLRAITGYSSMIEEDYANILDAEGIRLLIEVKNNAQKMGLLIDSLLAFSRLGKKEVRKTNVDMNIVVETVLKDINAGLNHKAQAKLDPLLPAYADYTLMQHVFSNLLSNAIKYSAKKEAPVINISSKQEGDETIYSVTDNGAGFEMDYAHKLFGVFQRLHSSDEFEGNGVGLAIVSRIINKHGGRIWAVGEVGKGATFSFSLPLIKENSKNSDNG